MSSRPSNRELAPVYAHTCNVPGPNGEEQECEACAHNRAAPAPEATREADAPTNLALAHELERVAVWIAEREVRLPVGVPGDPLDIVRRAIGWLRGERREQMPDARWLIRHDATCHAIAALVRQESESERAALSREIETLRADKARLDWFEREHPRVGLGEDGVTRLFARDCYGDMLAEAPTFREAIDAALAARAPEDR